MAGTVNHRGFGWLRKLPSGRWHASYMGPDRRRYSSPHGTYDSKVAADGWLMTERALVQAGRWTPPKGRVTGGAATTVTFGAYAAAWLADRTLKPRTRDHYGKLLQNQIYPTFADVPVKAITAHQIREWHTALGTRTPTLRSHAYGLLRTILGDAVHDGEIAANPAHIRGAGSTKRVHKIKPATRDELAALVTALPERYRLMALLAAWCGLRFGELAELRRSDVDTKNGVVHVRRGVVRVQGERIVGTPKSDAGTRNVHVPPHLLPALRDHLNATISGGRSGLLFPAADGVSHMAPSSLYKVFYPARSAAGRPDLRFHDLRHTGAVLTAQAGATLAELMGRLGHSTPGAALRYQHLAEGRDQKLAVALSVLADDDQLS